MKTRAASSTHKKVVVQMLDQRKLSGYLNPAPLGQNDTLDLLTPEGQHVTVPLAEVKSVYFVREFSEEFEPERKIFLSRPKLDGLWVRLKFRDNDVLEGIVPNDLLELLERGVQITPPDLHGQTLRIFVPRTALREMTVLGVVGVARHGGPKKRVAPETQPKLFKE